MDLPMVNAAPTERADAARNRQLILDAAKRLFAEQGVSRTSMDQVAAAAGVGKGTLFRRFGSRSALSLAVLDETERRFQDDLLRGPPPVGPGAPPRERLVAFGQAMLDNLEENGEILLDAELSDSGAYIRSAPLAFRWMHVRGLIEEMRPDGSSEYLADIFVAPLSPVLFFHQRYHRGMGLGDLKSAYSDLVRRVFDPGGSGSR
jgi:AcrR family transcriptional regulator